MTSSSNGIADNENFASLIRLSTSIVSKCDCKATIPNQEMKINFYKQSFLNEKNFVCVAFLSLTFILVNSTATIHRKHVLNSSK